MYTLYRSEKREKKNNIWTGDICIPGGLSDHEDIPLSVQTINLENRN